MARGDARDLFFRKLRTAGLSKPAVETLATRLDALEATDSAASGVSQLIASAAVSTGHASGDDIYPAMTLVASSGTDVTLDVDGQTIHCAAGIYDVSVVYYLISDTDADLLVEVDGLSSLQSAALLHQRVLQGQQRGALSALGVVVAAPADLALNFEMDSATTVTWSINFAQVTVRRVADAPNP